MHLTPSDPDIATIYRKISIQKRLDLQPDFQRGEVWGKSKKQKLIDSILRGWHIPPIHVIQIPDSEKQEVLDGQQRLVSIRDFIEGLFPINGKIEPFDSLVSSLDGLYWSELSNEVKSIIEDFTIRILTISDYLPDEPGELFYRLNQPTNLTSAEQRNAFFGESRHQIKKMSEYLEIIDFKSQLLGFSNSRMAYDDIISKFFLILEFNSLNTKITSSLVTSRFRDSTGFPVEFESICRKCLLLFDKCLKNRKNSSKINKATMLSWLIFIYQHDSYQLDPQSLIGFFDIFENNREVNGLVYDAKLLPPNVTRSFLETVFTIYQDRASSRVSDVSSVLLRNYIMWLNYSLFIKSEEKNIFLDKLIKQSYTLTHMNQTELENQILSYCKSMNWGSKLCQI